MEKCPRPIKGQQARRVKAAITLDGVLYDKLQEVYQEGYSISHIIDSALWLYFDKPTLSFEKEQNDGSNS
jgi:hypothetical protein